MLLPIEMLNSNELIKPLSQFVCDKVDQRKSMIASNFNQIFKIVFDLLKDVEQLEPRFACAFLQHESNGSLQKNYYKGLCVISPTEFEITLYLNQMGVFSLQEETNTPGCVGLKLCEGSKRSMSLWVEFITASGYLSARKIRSRFQSLIAKVCKKSVYSNIVHLISDPCQVKLGIHDVFSVIITPAFRYHSAWPKCAYNWPCTSFSWPSYSMIEQIKREGFDLCSKETSAGNMNTPDQCSQLEGDFWMLDFSQAEDRLLNDFQRKKCLSILKTLRDRHLNLPFKPVTNYHLKTLLLFECEKHCSDDQWIDLCLPHRINGIFLQLISCLQQRYLPHFFMPQTNLFRNNSIESLENASRQVWVLVRHLLTNSFSFDFL